MKYVPSSSIAYIAASHEPVSNPGVLKKVLLKSSELCSGTVQMVNWAELQPRRSFVKHYHKDMQEVFILLSEGAQAIVNNERIVLHSGDALIVDRNESHELINTTDTPIYFIVFGISEYSQGNKLPYKNPAC